MSRRLQALADMVTPGSRVADVGCDHGFVSVYLVLKGISPRVYAMDINKGPLLRAREHIAEYGLEAYIETRLSNGVEALQPGEAQTLLCAGMGGRLMQKILTEGGRTVRSMRELILQPQSEQEAFRRFLRISGYLITAENMIYEEGKFYPMMKAVPADRRPGTHTAGNIGKDGKAAARQRIEDKFGPCLLKNKNPVLTNYLRQNIKVYGEIRKQLEELDGQGSLKSRAARQERLEAVIEEMEDMRMALSEMENK